jgi:hypothetical protein
MNEASGRIAQEKRERRYVFAGNYRNKTTVFCKNKNY